MTFCLQIIEELPPPIQKDLVRHLYWGWLQQVPLFNDLEEVRCPTLQIAAPACACWLELVPLTEVSDHAGTRRQVEQFFQTIDASGSRHNAVIRCSFLC